MTAKIDLNSYDVFIDTFLDRETNEEREVVKIDNRLAFNPDFIASLKEMGVKKYVRREEVIDEEEKQAG